MEIVDFFKEYYNVDNEDIAFNKEDIHDNTKIFVGDLDCREDLVVFYPSLKVIIGNAYFNSLVTTIGLDDLSFIVGDAYFHALKSAVGLEHLKMISGDAFFDSLLKARGIRNLDTIAGLTYFGSLKRDKYLNNLHAEGPVYAPKVRKKHNI